MSAVAARARGLGTTLLPQLTLDAIDRARDPSVLVEAIGVADAEAVDRMMRDRAAADLATLARWTRALAPLELDEDRHSLRAMLRGLAARVPASHRLAGCVATASLPARVLAELAAASDPGELADRLVRIDHPFAPVLAGAREPLDLLALELALARRFAQLARSRDRALRTHLAQLIDVELVAAAIALAERGSGIDPTTAFIRGGARIDRSHFVLAARSTPDAARELLARPLADTPLPRALFALEPAALDDAALAWQLATQTRLRRLAPLGLAPAIHTVLRRRAEARHLRRAAWRLALAGGAR